MEWDHTPEVWRRDAPAIGAYEPGQVGGQGAIEIQLFVHSLLHTTLLHLSMSKDSSDAT